MGKYQGYEKYKDSGVEWLGEIPEHWEIWKVTHGFKNVGSGTTPKSDNPDFYDGDIPWITTSELRESVIEDTSQKVTKEALRNYSTLKIYPKGSVAIAMYGATIGRLGILGIDATVNQACCVFSESEVFHLPFFYYWLWMHRPNLIALSAGGGQPNLSQDDLKQLRLAIPPLEEQNTIAQFLDHKTSQIDALISKKEALLEKLDEKRTALISHAVTKGLDPTVPMKDSGIEWLGDIPAHWTIIRLKHLSEKITDGEHISPKNTDTGIPLLSAKDIRERDIKFDDASYVSEEDAHSFWKRCKPEKGDILIVSRGATVGRIGFVEKDVNFCLMGSVILIKLNDIVYPDFVYFASNQNHVQKNIIQVSDASAQQAIYLIDVKETKFSIPPYEEQEEIAKYLNQRTWELDQQKSKINKAIDLLKEYRTALITNAVTGKIDVRQVPIPQP
ncbi:MAG: restriction endonuclease subunit S [Coleofasciculus chthonoplastes F3-SA18-01]|uniref:restriction endonuclease subunit S n=1 Tax=Coleofasciculus chthonoplastes TaxID=64178 RepID=UPI0032F4D01D